MQAIQRVKKYFHLNIIPNGWHQDLEIMFTVKTTASKWKQLAKNEGISNAEIDRMSQAFVQH